MFAVFYAKLAFFTVFVFTLQTDFAAHWCFQFSANNSSIEQVWPPPLYLILFTWNPEVL